MLSPQELFSVTHTIPSSAACYRKKGVDSNHVIIPGIQSKNFGYYIATEQQNDDKTWTYSLLTFVPRKSPNTYSQLIKIINSEM